MVTSCCKHKHCWRCKTKSHEGVPCEAHLDALDNSVVPCPQCGVSLAKADGCNSVTCFCGFQFGWTEQKKKIDNATSFLAAYPEDTTGHCVRILTDSLDPEALNLSLGWKAIHAIHVNQGLMKWWKTAFPLCPAQCCAVPTADIQAHQGRKDAMLLFRSKYPSEVAHCEAENRLAISSLFVSMYPEDERPLAALLMFKNRNKGNLFLGDVHISRSARVWAAANKPLIEMAECLYNQRTLKSFLFLHGALSPSVFRHDSLAVSGGSEWALDGVSNQMLTYTNNNNTACRRNGVSCYPAAFVPVTSPQCRITFELTAAPMTVSLESL